MVLLTAEEIPATVRKIKFVKLDSRLKANI